MYLFFCKYKHFFFKFPLMFLTFSKRQQGGLVGWVVPECPKERTNHANNINPNCL